MRDPKRFPHGSDSGTIIYSITSIMLVMALFKAVASLLLMGTYLISGVSSEAIDPLLTGTWSTKSQKVITGPGFYDPVNDRMIEPANTGISYSFTDDGFFEEAYYRATSNPTNPKCPQGVMQFQHGTYTKDASNGSLLLSPFGVDGRQLLSNPCQSKTSVLSRYIQPEVFNSYEVVTDDYHKVQRLNLFGSDGTPMQPLYLVYQPPQMLPTMTMNPTSKATSQARATGKVKRSGVEVEIEVPFNKGSTKKDLGNQNFDTWWWVGIGMTGMGAIGFLCF